MFYAVFFYFFAGVVTGAVFRVRCLLPVLLIVLAEAVCLELQCTWLAAFGAVTGIIVTQVGYVVGLLGRAVFAQADQLMWPADGGRPQ